MAQFIYSKTEFNPQIKINKEQYIALKKEINKNPYFIIGEESLMPSIKNHILWAVISFFIMLIGFGLGEGITTMIGGFAMLSFITSIIYIILEVPSRVKTFKNQRTFFNDMKSKISLSDSFEEFCNLFYGFKLQNKY